MSGHGNDKGGDAHHDKPQDHGHEGDAKGSRNLGVDLADAHTSDQIKQAIQKDDPKLAAYINKHFGDVTFSEDGNGDVVLHDGKGGHVPHGWDKFHVDHGHGHGDHGDDGNDVTFDNGTRFKHDGEMDFKDGTILKADDSGSTTAIKLMAGDHLNAQGDLISGSGIDLMPGNPLEAAKQESQDQAAGQSTGADSSSGGTASSDSSAATSTAVSGAEGAVTEASSDVSSGQVDTSTKVGIDTARAQLDQAIAEFKPGQAPVNLIMARMSLDSAANNIEPQLDTYMKGSALGLSNSQIDSVEKIQGNHTHTTGDIDKMLRAAGTDASQDAAA